MVLALPIRVARLNVITSDFQVNFFQYLNNSSLLFLTVSGMPVISRMFLLLFSEIVGIRFTNPL